MQTIKPVLKRNVKSQDKVLGKTNGGRLAKSRKGRFMCKENVQPKAGRRRVHRLLWSALAIAVMTLLLMHLLNILVNRGGFHGEEREMPGTWREIIEFEEAKANPLTLPSDKAHSNPFPRRIATAAVVHASVVSLAHQFDKPVGFPWEKKLYYWRPGMPLDSEIIKWLSDHGDLIEQLLAFDESGYLPPSPRKHYEFSWPHEWGWMCCGHEILFAEMQKQQSVGDRTGARRIAEALIGFDDTLDRQQETMGADTSTFYYDRSERTTQLTWMVEADLLSPALREYLRQNLAEKHLRIHHFTEIIVSDIGISGQSTRQLLIKMLNSPWNSEFFLENDSNQRSRIRNALVAMKRARSMKSHADAMVRQYDDYILAKIEYSRLSYPEMAAQAPPQLSLPIPREKYFDFIFSDPNPLPQRKILRCLDETRLNLLRAALESKQGGHLPVGGAGLDLHGDPENPWRDPFTERPFKLVEATSATLIYSPGPDLKDQNGIVECDIHKYRMDPKKTAPPSGDLTIRLSR